MAKAVSEADYKKLISGNIAKIALRKAAEYMVYMLESQECVCELCPMCGQQDCEFDPVLCKQRLIKYFKQEVNR